MIKEYTGINKVEFVTSVANEGDYLDLDRPQIAIVGKSNVGKSSFINAICRRNKLAKTSQSPGKTRLINYFSCEDERFYLVDLPGYGYAKASKVAQQKWGVLIEGYLSEGGTNHVIMLVDSRHPPTKDDKLMLVWLQFYNIPFTIIATKIDKISKGKRAAALNSIKKELKLIEPIIGVSSSDKLGLFEIRDRIYAIVEDYYQIRDFAENQN